MDAQSQDLMLATIREKEERAERLLKEAKISCEILKQETRQKQEDLLKEAQGQAEAMKAEAREAGHSEGMAAGREEGIAQIREEQKQLLLDAFDFRTQDKAETKQVVDKMLKKK